MVRTRIHPVSVLLFAILLLTCAVVGGAEPRSGGKARVVSPMLQEILDNKAVSRVRVADLVASLEGITDQDEILRIEREIEQEKVASQMEMIRIQVRFARERGDGETADKLETGLAVMAKQMEVGAETSQEANK